MRDGSRTVIDLWDFQSIVSCLLHYILLISHFRRNTLECDMDEKSIGGWCKTACGWGPRLIYMGVVAGITYNCLLITSATRGVEVFSRTGASDPNRERTVLDEGELEVLIAKLSSAELIEFVRNELPSYLSGPHEHLVVHKVAYATQRYLGCRGGVVRAPWNASANKGWSCVNPKANRSDRKQRVYE